ncbi:PREDICTED: NXPE family member 3-like [Branchiostoma belcheri]|uniref:NXPE family member 3-like n=1 Tax=Branchiostoma belcheri TaxID=7741 RepID=A0A6P4Y1T0_BRABE|nr:PREDICTED: NXPE family member 3-like [Branchiostoma belcheri]
MRKKTMFVKGLPILVILLVVLFIKSKPEVFDVPVNKMLPNQIFRRNMDRRLGQQEMSIPFSANDQPAVPKEENKVSPNQNLPNKNGGQDKTIDDKAASSVDQPTVPKEENKVLPNQNLPNKNGERDKTTDDKAASTADQPIASKEENKVLPNQNAPNKDGGQDKTIDDKATSSADQPSISKASPNQNPPNNDGGQEKRMDDKAASSVNDQPIISQEKDKVLPNQNLPNNNGGQEKRINDNAAPRANDQPDIIKEKDKVLPNQNLPNNDGGQDKTTDDKAASSANDQPIITQEKDKVLPNQNAPNKDGGQERRINDNASASQPIISNDKNNVLPNQNPPQNDVRQNKVSANNNAIPPISPTSSEKTIAHILNRRLTYRVGDELLLRIVARDAFNRPKTVGGDFFTTQLTTTSPVQASTAGRIKDYGNGTYLARFILGWPGLVTATVRLVHSSEAVSILKKSRSDKIRRFFSCMFQDPKTNSTEWTSCTFNQNEKAEYSRNICDFSRPDINVTWYCHKPRSAPCEPPIQCRQDRNKSLGVDDLFSAEEKALLEGDKVEVPGNISLNVKERDTGMVPKGLPKCGLHLPEPASEGYWYNGTWFSLRCRVQQGFDREAAVRCLRNKTIYLQGDSTLRQWYSEIARDINTVDNPNKDKFLGPRVTTNKTNNIKLHFRFHHFPVGGPPPRPMNVFSFTADEIKNMIGGPDVVIVLGLWGHFSGEPMETFVSRMYGIRHAIQHLHSRYPETKVFVRSSNTRGFVTFSHLRDNSNWYAYQVLQETKEILGDLNVTILDVWDMSVCQWHEHSVHPHDEVIKNHLDMFYSYICPQ